MYAWAITKDHIADQNAKQGTNDNATTLIGPRGAEHTFFSMTEYVKYVQEHNIEVEDTFEGMIY